MKYCKHKIETKPIIMSENVDSGSTSRVTRGANRRFLGDIVCPGCT